jgi:U4/U6 small nuclear ribonucleoprotein PRP3
MSSDNNGVTNGDSKRRRKRRWGDVDPAAAPAVPPPAPPAGGGGAIDSKAKALALQASIKARLEALKAKTGPVTSKKRPPPTKTSAQQQQQPSTKRAKVYELDLSVTGPTFHEKAAPEKPKINPYLAHTIKEDNEESEETEAFVDERLTTRRERKRHKELNFVEPGKFVEIAERKRTKAANAEQSGFASGRKAGMYFQSSNMANIYGSTEVLDDDDSRVAPRAEANEKTVMPFVVEWWDLELLPGTLKKQVGTYEGKVLSKAAQSQMQQLDTSSKKGSGVIANLVNPEVDELRNQCFDQAMLSYSKTAALVQHIIPIKPQNAKDGPEAEPTLYLTKKERKRQRKLRREEKQRELQDLQAAGLMPPPEPRLTLKNFIRVLGDQAFVDPSQMEQKVTQQVQARQRAHMERNEANKLTKEQRSTKLAKKYMEDTSGGLHVALFYVKDMSHPYHRTKVDLNAQQYNITGGVVECQNPQLSCVICEGGPKAIKKYTRLMMVRMKWKGPDNAEEEEDDDEQEDEEGVKPHKFNPENKCELVWTGMASKRFFKGFVFQACETSDQASKILRAKGVGHFWDQVLTHASGRGESFQLKLGESDDDEDEGANVYGPSGGEQAMEDAEMGEV